jgi:hypothetical protein
MTAPGYFWPRFAHFTHQPAARGHLLMLATEIMDQQIAPFGALTTLLYPNPCK